MRRRLTALIVRMDRLIMAACISSTGAMFARFEMFVVGDLCSESIYGRLQVDLSTILPTRGQRGGPSMWPWCFEAEPEAGPGPWTLKGQGDTRTASRRRPSHLLTSPFYFLHIGIYLHRLQVMCTKADDNCKDGKRAGQSR